MPDKVRPKTEEFVSNMREYVKSSRWHVKRVPSFESELLDKINECLVEIDRLEVKNKRLKEALDKYGSHEKSCPRYAGPESNPCLCGFEQALIGE